MNLVLPHLATEAMVLAQLGGVFDDGLLATQAPNVKIVAAVLGGLLTATAVHYSSKAAEMTPALGMYIVGLGLAVGTGFALNGMMAAVFAGGVYLLLASAWEAYVLGRAPTEAGMWAALAGIGVATIMVLTDAKTAAFAASSVLIVYSSLRVLKTNVLVHATIWLAGMLIGVAGIYLSLGAEFLAIIQVLIYVGAVVTLFLFTVMLTIPEEGAHGLDDLVLPPGVTVESIVDLEEATPRMGAGPYKGFQETNPRKPLRAPPTLYGVSMADGVYGDEKTDRKGKKESKEA